MSAEAGPRRNVKTSQEVDSLCDRFESLWRSGQRPRLEDFLASADKVVLQDAFGDLLALDVDYRADAGEVVAPESYLQRFPEFHSSINGFFSERSRLETHTCADTHASSASSAVTLPLGPFGNYEILGEIARGGMGVVYKARQGGLDRLVAVKVISAPRSAPVYIERFQSEARTAARLQHPGIVSIFEVGQIEGMHFFSMELLPGKTLAELAREQRVSPEQAVRFARDIALAVDFAHEQGVLHRDLKPSNVMVDPAERLKVMDFGLAKVVEGSSNMTQDGELLGTPNYMSPEQASGDWSQVDRRTDIYAIGTILYELLTGRTPHVGKTPMATMVQVVHAVPPRPREINSEIDPQLERIVLRCLEKNAAARYATAAQLAADLDRYLSRTLYATAAAPIPKNASPPWYRQRRRLLGACGAAAAMFLGVVLIIRDQHGKTKARIPLNPGDQFEISADARPAEQTDLVRPAAPPSDATGPSKSPAPATMADKEAPFVVVRAKGGKNVECSTLARAIELHQADDVVEVYGNGPFRTGMIRVKGNLTLRAAPGYRPQFKAALVSHDAILDMENGNLLVEGCDFRRSFVVIGSLFSGKGAEWEFRNCRFLGGSSTAISYDGPKLRLVDCLLSFSGCFGRVIDPRAEKLSWEMENCIVRAPGNLFELGETSKWKLMLRHNTFLTNATLIGKLAGEAQLEVEAEGNIFQINDINLNAYTAAPAYTWVDHVHWQGKGNLYVGRRDALIWQLDEKGEEKSHGLAGLQQIWGRDEPGSEEATLFYPAWREPYLAQSSHELLAAFRKYSDYRRQTLPADFSMISPDWETIGPGMAYVKALTAEGRRVAKDQLRPKAVEGAPFVILRNGKMVRAFDQLAPALAAAEHGDMVEIRTDDAVPSADLPIPQKPMAITIRAAPGYLPIIEGSAGWLAPGVTLTVEGIHFRKGALGLSGGYSNSGKGCRLARIANCSFSPDPSTGTQVWSLGDPWSFLQPTLNGQVEIVNCLAPGVVSLHGEASGRYVMRNSVLGAIVEQFTPGDKPTTVEIERSLMWLPASYQGPGVAFSGGDWTAKGPFILPQIVLRGSVVENSASLLGLGNSELKLAGWKGEHNVFAVGEGHWYSIYAAEAPVVTNLGSWQALWDSDSDSFQVDPIVYDARSWKLLPGTPGAQQGPEGRDLGADVSRIAVVQPSS